MHYNKGFKLALITAGFSGVAVFLNSLTVKVVGDALVFTTIKNLGVGLLLLGVLIRKKINWVEVKQNWKQLGLIGIIGGSLAFYLFFKGLMLTSPVMGSMIHKTLVLWVGLLGFGVLKERLNLKQGIALAGVFGASALMGGFNGWSWGKGETMILAATILWAVENILAKKVLRKVSVETVAGSRMIVGSIILLAVTVSSGKLGLILNLNGWQWGMTLVSIGLLSGYVLSWYKALSLAPVSLVGTVLSLGSLITSGLNSVFITHSLSIELIYQTLLLSIFSYIFVKEAQKNARFVKVQPLRISAK
ncbi:MAG: DMT family transporter [Candidatus Beckwithbacteria bacterium]